MLMKRVDRNECRHDAIGDLGGARAAVFPAAAAPAQAPFFKGKTINLVVGYSAGGGYDQYARLLARHFGRHIAGNPTVIVQNMPGAATMTSVRHLDINTSKDGTVIALFDPGLILESVASSDDAKVNFAGFQR